MKNVQEECQYFLTCYNPNIIMSGVVIVLTFRNNLYILSCMNSKPTELGKFKLMCCSRKYPHPSHGRFLSLNIHPPENSGLATYFLLKRLVLNPLLPLGISINLPRDCGYGCFLEIHNLYIRGLHNLYDCEQFNFKHIERIKMP